MKPPRPSRPSRRPRWMIKAGYWVLPFLPALPLYAQPPTPAALGFAEKFAFAPDRSVPLAELVPGTPDFYTYHILNAQNTGDLPAADKLLDEWTSRLGQTPESDRLRLRQQLLRYSGNSAQTLRFLQENLSLSFDRQPELPDSETPDEPANAVLDPSLIAPDQLLAEALANHDDLSGLTDAGLDLLAAAPGQLKPERLRQFLSRLALPDTENLVALVLRDLDNPHTGGFGSLPIHLALTLPQLEELRSKRPDLASSPAYVNAVLLRLAPPAGSDPVADPALREAWLRRLHSFASTLPPAFNSLKAIVLHRLLSHLRSQGQSDKTLFLQYLKLPRPAPSANSEYLRAKSAESSASLYQTYPGVPEPLPGEISDPDGDLLLANLLSALFLTESSYNEYLPYLNESWLQQVFAETRLLAGLGEPSDLLPLLGPARLAALRDRVDLTFAPENPILLAPSDAVKLDLLVKNAPTLLVRTYAIRTRNFFRQRLSELSTAVDLDGLAPTSEQTFTYTEPPIRRLRRSFDFPELSGPGAWIIEFIGGGQVSRALVQKGRLHATLRTSAAGQEITVRDAAGAPVPNAIVWLDGREYPADSAGAATIPFSANSTAANAVLSSPDGLLSSLFPFTRQTEDYAFQCPVLLPRETLLAGRDATLLLRPSLTLAGQPAPLALLKNPRLTVTFTDGDGIHTTRTADLPALSSTEETPWPFRVPADLRSLSITITAQVPVVSKNQTLDLSATHSVSVNSLDSASVAEALHPLRTPDGFLLEARGRNGEPRPGRTVNLVLSHRQFTDTIETTLRTDKNGQIRLGALPDILSATATLESSGEEVNSVTLRPDLDLPATDLPSELHAAAGQTIRIPFLPSDGKTLPRRDIAFFELTDSGAFARDLYPSLTLAPGFLEIPPLPPGDYQLILKPTSTPISLRVSPATSPAAGWLPGPARDLQENISPALQIISAEFTAAGLQIRLANSAPADTRLHLLASRQPHPRPSEDLLGLDLPLPAPEYTPVPRSLSSHESGVRLGEEQQYILDRRREPGLPGLMLPRPGLLLAPWKLRDTSTTSQSALEGDAFAGVPSPVMAPKPAPASSLKAFSSGYRTPGRDADDEASASSSDAIPSLDFLDATPVLLANLRPAADGTLLIPAAQLPPDHPRILLLATDSAGHTARRTLLRAPAPLRLRDLRLRSPFDPAIHRTEQRQITLAPAAKPFTLPDAASSDLELLTSLPQHYALLRTLAPQLADLALFDFLPRWPSLAPARKAELYSQYASHELNFFLSLRDPEFFKSTVLPFLANKKDKTFLDLYLTGADLSPFLQPARYRKLNTFEQILLARKSSPEETKSTARHLREITDLLPPDPQRDLHLFDTVLRGQSDPSSGVQSEMESLRNEDRKKSAMKGGAGYEESAAAGNGPAESLAMSMPAPPPAPASPAMQPAAAAEPMMDKLEESDRGIVTGSALGATTASRQRATNQLQDLEKRKQARPLYIAQEKTSEWAENNYWHLPIEQQGPDLIPPSPFWTDFAAHDPAAGPFLSPHLAEATRNLTEALLALALTDLPFTTPAPAVKSDGPALTLTPPAPALAWTRQFLPVPDASAATGPDALLVRQHTFRADDPVTTLDNGEERAKYLPSDGSAEYISGVIYGARVIIANPTDTPRSLTLLLQIPPGALPIATARPTRGIPLDLDAYATTTHEYFFYFPEPGSFTQFPPHASERETLLGFAQPVTYKVLRTPTRPDTTSWDYLSQRAPLPELLAYLEKSNLALPDLDRLAWRMKDKSAYAKILDLLAPRHAWSDLLWSYSLLHRDEPRLRDYLASQPNLVAQAGPVLDTPLLAIDPVETRIYQHLEYAPLVNARAHRLGPQRQILNDRFLLQYASFLSVLAHRPALRDTDRLAASAYLLLQDRLPEALAQYAAIPDPSKLTERLQADYLALHLRLAQGDLPAARALAEAHRSEPVPRWRDLYNQALAQLDQIEGKTPTAATADPAAPPLPGDPAASSARDQLTENLAATEPALAIELRDNNTRLALTTRNLEKTLVRYYRMDPELLFSRDPFAQEFSAQFSIVRPALETEIPLAPLPSGQTAHLVDIPPALLAEGRSLLIETEAAGLRRSLVLHPGKLGLQVIEAYGQVRVTAPDGTPVPGAYVKAYARATDGSIQFHKDGYTDRRGLFDYATLSTDALDRVSRLALFVDAGPLGLRTTETPPPPR